MPKNKPPFIIHWYQFLCVLIAPFSIFMLLLVIFAPHQAQASSQHSSALSGQSPRLALQNTVTPTATLQNVTTLTETQATSTYSFSLTTLGYDETTLQSPFGDIAYSFRVPENWLIETDGLFELDLSYTFNQVESEESPIQLGDLTVKLDDQTLAIFTITQTVLSNYRLRIPVPFSKLTPNRGQYDINLQFAAGSLCNSANKAALIIHPTSTLTLNYSQRPLVVDLARYPRPFFQPDFSQDTIRFVLPTKVTVDDAKSALGIAAKLGNLSNNRQVISATTDVDFRRLLSSTSVIKEHLFVIGKPQSNQLLLILNDVAKLPVSLHKRQLELNVQAPTLIAPGDTFSYVFTVTNTINRVINFSLINSLSTQLELLDCTPECTQNSQNNLVTWDRESLGISESAKFNLTLKASDTLTNTLENTLTLNETDKGPVNVATLVSQVMTDSSESTIQIFTRSNQDGYFFVYNGLAVAEGDGIVQEIPSPWSEKHAILVITGLSDEAIKKAGQAMSSEPQLPGIAGSVALVQTALSPLEINQTTLVAVEKTLADLGYGDRVVRGQSPASVEYYFRVPYGWQLTDSAGIDLYFNHSGLIDYEQSGVTVLLNREPVGSVSLSEKTTNDGYIRVNLGKANIRTGELNRLSIQAHMPLAGACAEPNSDQAWFVIKSASKISLTHDELGELALDLDHLPYPFHIYPALTDLLFALPETPTIIEWENALQVAASVGNSAAWKTLVPQVAFGDNLSKDMLEKYQIIVIGRPSRNTLLQQANMQLPQPFLPDQDEIEQRLDDVVLRLPSGINLGYIQLIPSPWNDAHALLAITGTTDQGVAQAVKILINQPGSLKGNLALVKDDAVNTLDTRLLTNNGVAVAVTTVVPEMTPITTPTFTIPTPSVTPTSPLVSLTPEAPTSVQTPVKTEWPSWLVPLIGINGLLVIAIFVFAFRQTRHKG